MSFSYHSFTGLFGLRLSNDTQNEKGQMSNKQNDHFTETVQEAKAEKVVYHLPDSLTGRCWRCGKKRGVKYGGVCYSVVSEDELTDMFGEGGKEEVKESFDEHLEGWK